MKYKLNKILKRLIDLVLSIFLIFLLFPIFLIIAILIKIDSKGPVLFKQRRLGLNGKVFLIYKFRSMVENAEFMETGLFNLENDPRVTRIGRLLRNYSLDELPQLINVIKGELSLVGPRPPVEYELGKYENFDDKLKKRFTVKPGITGLAQINGRNQLSWDEKIIYDLEYIEKFNKYGILYDIVILFRTFIKVFKREGIYENYENIIKDSNKIDKEVLQKINIKNDIKHWFIKRT